MPQFEKHIGIDYSGAETPTSSWKALQVYAADGVAPPRGVPPPPSPRKHGTRRGVAEWLVSQLFTDHIGSPDWRPRNTQDVAKRLSLWALKNEYGQKRRPARFAASD